MSQLIRNLLGDAGHEDLPEDDYEIAPHTEGPSILAESNRAALMADAPDPDVGGEPVAIDCGTDGVLVRSSHEWSKERIANLDGYPVADESDFSEREFEEEQRAWEDYGRVDMRRELERYVDARLKWLGQAPVSAMIELTDEQVDAIYHAQCEAHCGGEHVTWEEDYDGSHAAFHIDRAVWGDNSYETRKSVREGNPRWDSHAWDGLVPSLTDGRIEYHTGEIVAWDPAVDVTPVCPRCNASVPGERDEYPLGLWYDDCGNPVCDVPTPRGPLSSLAFAVLRGDEQSLAVLQDAIEESGDAALAKDLAGRSRRFALKEIVKCNRPYPQGAYYCGQHSASGPVEPTADGRCPKCSSSHVHKVGAS